MNYDIGLLLLESEVNSPDGYFDLEVKTKGNFMFWKGKSLTITGFPRFQNGDMKQFKRQIKTTSLVNEYMIYY